MDTQNGQKTTQETAKLGVQLECKGKIAQREMLVSTTGAAEDTRGSSEESSNKDDSSDSSTDTEGGSDSKSEGTRKESPKQKTIEGGG